jgi:hypothetical protein
MEWAQHMADDFANRLTRIEAALFDPEHGLIYIRSWMCRLLTWVSVIVGTVAGIVMFSAQLLHLFNII